MVKEEYYDNYRMIEAATEKILLTKKDVAEVLKISRPTVNKTFGKYFKSTGYISKATLARALTD